VCVEVTQCRKIQPGQVGKNEASKNVVREVLAQLKKRFNCHEKGQSLAQTNKVEDDLQT
jgi:hypothetical protein